MRRVLAGGLTAATVSTGVASAQGIPNLAYKGTITMYAANYNPKIKGVTPPPGALTDQVTALAAAAFEKMYPNIKIQFVPGSAEIGTGSYYISESAAGALPDIDEVPGYYVNVTLPFGIFQDLLPSFQKPNPYIPGNKSWISTMNPVALHIDSAPGNTPGTTGILRSERGLGRYRVLLQQEPVQRGRHCCSTVDVEPAAGRLHPDSQPSRLQRRLCRGVVLAGHLQLVRPLLPGQLPRCRTR